jgi:hypothetical protein
MGRRQASWNRLAALRPLPFLRTRSTPARYQLEFTVGAVYPGQHDPGRYSGLRELGHFRGLRDYVCDARNAFRPNFADGES